MQSNEGFVDYTVTLDWDAIPAVTDDGLPCEIDCEMGCGGTHQSEWKDQWYHLRFKCSGGGLAGAYPNASDRRDALNAAEDICKAHPEFDFGAYAQTRAPKIAPKVWRDGTEPPYTPCRLHKGCVLTGNNLHLNSQRALESLFVEYARALYKVSPNPAARNMFNGLLMVQAELKKCILRQKKGTK